MRLLLDAHILLWVISESRSSQCTIVTRSIVFLSRKR
jgi:hypothetical protein